MARLCNADAATKGIGLKAGRKNATRKR